MPVLHDQPFVQMSSIVIRIQSDVFLVRNGAKSKLSYKPPFFPAYMTVKLLRQTNGDDVAPWQTIEATRLTHPSQGVADRASLP